MLCHHLYYNSFISTFAVALMLKKLFKFTSSKILNATFSICEKVHFGYLHQGFRLTICT